jgi:hypothetical protein
MPAPARVRKVAGKKKYFRKKLWCRRGQRPRQSFCSFWQRTQFVRQPLEHGSDDIAARPVLLRILTS